MNLVKPVYIIGDIHGAFGRFRDVVRNNNLEDCYIICVGDLGIGFQHPAKGEIHQCKKQNIFFQERNIHFYSIRGNHDDPDYFNGSSRIQLSNFNLLPDYHFEEINGEKFLFVGGAVSIDRQFRVLNRSYWTDEEFVLKPELVKECDVLITHSAPTWNGPFDKEGLAGWCLRDTKLWDDCYKERIAHDQLIKLCKPKNHYCGHFHAYHWVEFQGCYSTILDIEQIKEHRLIQDNF